MPRAYTKKRAVLTEDDFYRINAFFHANPKLSCAEIGKMFYSNGRGGYSATVVKHAIRAESFADYKKGIFGPPRVVRKCANALAETKSATPDETVIKDIDVPPEFDSSVATEGAIAIDVPPEAELSDVFIRDALSKMTTLLSSIDEHLVIPDDSFNSDMSVAKKMNMLCAAIGGLKKLVDRRFDETNKFCQSMLETESEAAIIHHNVSWFVQKIAALADELRSERQKTNMLLEKLLNVWTSPSEIETPCKCQPDEKTDYDSELEALRGVFNT